MQDFCLTKKYISRIIIIHIKQAAHWSPARWSQGAKTPPPTPHRVKKCFYAKKDSLIGFPNLKNPQIECLELLRGYAVL